jgi:hypothetical protein
MISTVLNAFLAPLYKVYICRLTFTAAVWKFARTLGKDLMYLNDAPVNFTVTIFCNDQLSNRSDETPSVTE